MSDRVFRLFIGTYIITALYFELPNFMIALIAVLMLEGVTNWRIPLLASRLRFGRGAWLGPDKALWPVRALCNIPFEAERAWRFMVAFLLLVTYIFYYQYIWFMPWFIGFATFGAGLSGVCPMLLALKLIGFK